MKRKYIIYLLVGILLVPVAMWLAWLVTPNKKMVIAIVDKTESRKKGNQHMSLIWVLNNERYTKTHQKLYNIDQDYFGFSPGEKSSYRIKGLERFSTAQLDQLSNDCDATYYVDTYGVYNADLPTSNKSGPGSAMIYGGMSQQDIDFLKRIKEQKKLIISEYNILEPPTHKSIREQFEKIFGIRWTGWTARYFDSLDPEENKNLPAWLVSNYKIRNGGKWPFTKAGVAFVNEAGDVVVLEDLVDLSNPLPFITVDNEEVLAGLPHNTKYPFWFDVIEADTAINKVTATFNISYTEKGGQQMQAHHIPLRIPAVVMHKSNDYQFYYFSGNFSSTNNLSISSSHFKWISIFKRFLFNEDDTLESSSFFWNFYRPLLASILGNYNKEVSRYREK